MENFRPQKSPGSDRFLGLFSPPDANGTSPLELHEDEVFWTGSDPPDPTRSPRPPSTTANPSPSPFSPSSRGGGASFRHLSKRNFGILAALPEDDKKLAPMTSAPFLQRKPSISSSAASSASTSPSSSSARMIPAIPKPKPEFSLSVPAGKIQHQSVPVNVPVVPARERRGDIGRERERDDRDGDEEDEMLPPHEIVARAHGGGSPMTTFSVLEGAGRTLKGRDLRRVRNAVFRQTGFLD